MCWWGGERSEVRGVPHLPPLMFSRCSALCWPPALETMVVLKCLCLGAPLVAPSRQCSVGRANVGAWTFRVGSWRAPAPLAISFDVLAAVRSRKLRLLRSKLSWQPVLKSTFQHAQLPEIFCHYSVWHHAVSVSIQMGRAPWLHPQGKHFPVRVRA